MAHEFPKVGDGQFAVCVVFTPKEGKFDEFVTTYKANPMAVLSKAKGLVNYIFCANKDKTKLQTILVFESQEAFAEATDDKKNPDFAKAKASVKDLMASPPEPSIWSVQHRIN